MSYLGTKPANSPLTSELIPDGLIATSDLANGAVTQDKLSTYIAPKGTPAFSAYLGTNQTVTQSTWTKLNINTEEFDTNSNYDTGNYRFTPTVAGYYQVNGGAYVINTNQTYNSLAIFKNGSIYKGSHSTSSTGSYLISISALVYLNGSTDYIELYGQTTGGDPRFGASSTQTYFQASMVRAA